MYGIDEFNPPSQFYVEVDVLAVVTECAKTPSDANESVATITSFSSSSSNIRAAFDSDDRV